MAKVKLSEMIKRLPAEEQTAIHEKSAKITTARTQARELEDKTARDGAARLLSKAA